MLAQTPKPESKHPEYIIGLDLVFTGVSGYSVFEYPGTPLLDQGILMGKRVGTEIERKIKNSTGLSQAIDNLFEHYPNSVCIIEQTDWKQNPSAYDKRNAERERNTLKSLAMARGIAVALALLNNRVLPLYLGVGQVRRLLISPGASKESQFSYIKTKYGLDLSLTEENMNITDSIALGAAFYKLRSLPTISQDNKRLLLTMRQTTQAVRLHHQAMRETFEEVDLLAAINSKQSYNFVRKIVSPNLVKGNEHYEAGHYNASIDISALHPGVVVYNPTLNSPPPPILYHKTFALASMGQEIDSVKEILVASNLLKILGILKIAFDVKEVAFEYADWHRSGSGLSYEIDRKAIDSLYFTYGVLMGAAAKFNLKLKGINATDAKEVVVGKRNATKDEIKGIIQQQFPYLKNEHTRDAAAVMLTCAAIENKTILTEMEKLQKEYRRAKKNPPPPKPPSKATPAKKNTTASKN